MWHLKDPPDLPTRHSITNNLGHQLRLLTAFLCLVQSYDRHLIGYITGKLLYKTSRNTSTPLTLRLLNVEIQQVFKQKVVADARVWRK